jgi:hypothetical protein
MVFISSLVIGAGGVGFGDEAAEPDFFPVDGDSGDPFAGASFEKDANIARG